MGWALGMVQVFAQASAKRGFASSVPKTVETAAAARGGRSWMNGCMGTVVYFGKYSRRTQRVCSAAAFTDASA